MLKDLSLAPERVTRTAAAVTVVGGGIAGLLLGTKLARAGIRVVVLESGGAASSPNIRDPLNEVEQRGQLYRGALEGRVRGLGGTSQIWGGAMLPFLACDLQSHTAGWPVEWPVRFSELEPYFSGVEATYSLPPGPFELERKGSGDFILRRAKWPTFSLRNAAKALRGEVASNSISVWTNATATGLKIDPAGRLCGITAQSRSGNYLELTTDHAVIAAGAIESTRLLLILDRQNDGRLFSRDEQLGRYFFDHLSAPAATIEPNGSVELNKKFGFAFEKGGMRDLRIEPSEVLRRKAALPAAFAHVTATSEDDAVFAALRELYRAVQSQSRIPVSQLLKLSCDLPWLVRASLWRVARRRLLFPRGARHELVLVTEQYPSHRSTIGLSTTAQDIFGLPQACINWQTEPVDHAVFEALQDRLYRFWTEGPFASLGKATKTAPECWKTRLQADSDIFHPGGTTRMGTSPSSAVVDSNLRVFSVPNLRVVSTSCFPSGGGANPTFMLMAFALRAAEQLAREYGRTTTGAL